MQKVVYETPFTEVVEVKMEGNFLLSPNRSFELPNYEEEEA